MNMKIIPSTVFFIIFIVNKKNCKQYVILQVKFLSEEQLSLEPEVT